MNATTSTEADSSELEEHDHGAVRVLRLNRPSTKNSLTLDVVEALHAALGRVEADERVRALVLSGVPGAFCSGADLRWLLESVAAGSAVRDVMARFQALPLRIVELEKPVIACITGPAVGFGADLALACDLRVLAQSAYLQEKFVHVGLMPDGGGSYFLTRYVGSARALELLLLGTRIDSARALTLGLVTQVMADAEVEAGALALASSLAAGPALALSRIKHAVHGTAAELRAALAREAEGQLSLLQSEDVQEGVRAFMEQRAPVFTGK
jgi:enoyl-CoA hydratase/carnithine racemase